MADGASSAEDSPDDDSDLCRTGTGVQLSDTGSTAQARLPHRGKDWQLNAYFGIFLSLFLRHIIHVPFHIHHFIENTSNVSYVDDRELGN